MKTFNTRRSGGVLGSLVAIVHFVLGMALVGYSFLIGDPFADSAVFAESKVPSNTRMTLTVPEMRRVDHVPVYTGAASEESALHDGRCT